MEAKTYELESILRGDRRYVIPTFQRDYEWTKDGQWQLLFEDLDETADRLGTVRARAEAIGISSAKAESKIAPHFLGAIVCEQLPTPVGSIDTRAIIDGQQRMTTLQLLLRGLLDVLDENDHPRSKQVRRLLYNPDDVTNHDHEIHKLWPRRKDRELWPLAMGDAPPVGTSSKSHLYLQARQFFAANIRSVTTTPNGVDRLDDLVSAALVLFKLVVIDLDENDDAQVIFEVLNGRQTPLSASDLVKNLIFLRGEISDETELEQLYDRYWSEFDEQWWKTQVGTGHAQRAHRDMLLSVWLTAESREEASVAHLYGEVRSYLSNHDLKTEAILAQLHSYARAYKEIYAAAPVTEPELATAYGRLVRLKLTTAIPLLAWLRTLPKSRLGPEDHLRAVRAVEAWLLRRIICGWQTRGYNTVFLTVLRAATAAASRPLDDPEANIADAVVSALEAKPNGLSWPSDEDISQACATNDFYKMTKDRVRMVLGAIDKHLQVSASKNVPAVFDYETLQIEHVMPQAWREHWDDDGLSGRPDEASHRDNAVHTIGNLTLVTPAFNQSVSNLGWDTKQAEFAGQTKLEIAAKIHTHPTWNEERIAERGAELAKIACTVWPDRVAVGLVAPVEESPPATP